jgi:hypothetical protein
MNSYFNGMTYMMSQAAGEFEFIIVEQDHFTKCVRFVLLDMFAAFEVRLFRKVVSAVTLLR